MKRKTRKQLNLRFRSWGGKRKGSGRKPKGHRAGVSHRARLAFSRPTPVHVTMRVRKGVWSLRSRRSMRVLAPAISRSSERFGVRITHYSVQGNHMHFIVEAKDEASLSRAMQGLAVRIAKGLNRMMGRSGTVFADRFHAHILRSPREVKNAVRYVLENARRHAIRLSKALAPAPDPYAGGPPLAKDAHPILQPSPSWAPLKASTATPKTWLLRHLI